MPDATTRIFTIIIAISPIPMCPRSRAGTHDRAIMRDTIALTLEIKGMINLVNAQILQVESLWISSFSTFPPFPFISPYALNLSSNL